MQQNNKVTVDLEIFVLQNFCVFTFCVHKNLDGIKSILYVPRFNDLE